MFTVALIGGRGYTGAEFLALLSKHPALSLAFASSSSQAGAALRSACPHWKGDECFIELSPDKITQQRADIWVLAVPNNTTTPWVDAITAADKNAIIVDLSADHRFDSDWIYGLPEHHRSELVGAKRISNPGCYATGAQIALKPLVEQFADIPRVFGISGYSGAGKKPSANNDPNHLRDNLIPYRLTNHIHEREISYQLEHRVRFTPHVAAFFRGISLTFSITLNTPTSAEMITKYFMDFYHHEPLIHIDTETPTVQNIQETSLVKIGGFSVDANYPNELAFAAVIDNLLKGAASQALQNINIALDLDETLGILD